MENWKDPKVIVSIYAAIVSAVSLIWNIVVLISKSKSELLKSANDYNSKAL